MKKYLFAVGAGFYPARAERRCKFWCTDANTNAPVGADDPVRPLGTPVFAAMFRKTDCVCCTGRCGHRPLQTVCGFASVHPCLQVRTAGRTEASAPTGCCAFSPMVCAILRLRAAGESAASTPTDTLRGRQSSCKFVGASCAGGASPAPTLRRNA